MSRIGTTLPRNNFFQSVVPGILFVTGNIPTQGTFQNLFSSTPFFLNSEDSADQAQTQQGLVAMAIATDILNFTATKDLGFGSISLAVGPAQLPSVALPAGGGTVTVSQNNTTGALIYTLPAFKISSLKDVTLTSLSSGQFLEWNGTAWVNTNLYYQTILANTSAQTQRGQLNFSSVFSISDNSGGNYTSVTIGAGVITYGSGGMIQNTSGSNVLIGNPTGSASYLREIGLAARLVFSGSNIDIATNGVTYGYIQKVAAGSVLLGNASSSSNQAIQEITLSAELTLTSGSPNVLSLTQYGVTYGVNGMLQKASSGTMLLGNLTGSSNGNVQENNIVGFYRNNVTNPPQLQPNGYFASPSNSITLTAASFTQNAIIGMSYTATGAVTVNLPDPTTVVAGLVIMLKDTGGNASTHNITVNPHASETIDGGSSIKITTNYGYLRLFTDSVNWYSI